MFHRLLKKRQRIVELLLLQSLHALQDQELRLREASPKIMQLVQILQLLLRSGQLGLARATRCPDCSAPFRIQASARWPSERGNRAGQIAAGFQFHAQVVLCFGIVRIDFHRFAKLGEGAAVVCPDGEA